MSTCTRRRGIRLVSVASALALALASIPVAASAGEVDVVRAYREVPGSGVFHVCADGSPIAYASLSHRDYTTWFRDGVPVREHRHITFDGTLTRGEVTTTYTGVWNRDQDLVTGEQRITGGQFRVDVPSGGTLVGAGVRAEGNEFKATGDRFLRELCTALGA
ncbi:hypothetical protein ABZ477_09770 [Microbacterium sp. NPDC019599]|uniref:hypothetical protein n=1 Tax=Microbacterium sp. NPDC019599 TaxID=3154690 RepID=UPI0033F25485